MPTSEQSNLKEKVRRLSSEPGVYLMKDRLGGVIYVGKAKNLKKRVSTYFQPSRPMRQHPKIRALVDSIADFEVIEVRSEPEALLLEGKLIKQYKPRYNTDFTDDKRFLLVRLDEHRPIPRFSLVRFRKEDQARYFGPFAHSGHLRKTLAEMRRRFGVVLSDANPQPMGDGRYRLYDDVRADLYGFSNEVTIGEYRGRLDLATEFLEGKSREWLGELRIEMQEAAARQAYEKAAELRDIVFALEKTLARTRKFVRDPTVVVDEAALSALRDALQLPVSPQVIECFDISHISGSFVVASLVQFRDGKPEKTQYRRYRIRSFIGNDDFRAMEEVVGRRYQRLNQEDRSFPNLILIDGGKGQVSAAVKAFASLDLPMPPLYGLAKKEELLIPAQGGHEIRLPAHHPGLRLLQRVRDEAHRFANTYNADLRSRRVRESVLDDFPGLGPKRRADLLRRFRSLERLRRATAAELSEVPGIGPKLAIRLAEFFSQGKDPPAEVI